MGRLEEISPGWQAVLSDIDRLSELESGAFGHVRQRRLGLRARTSCWALVSRGSSSMYALAVELSATGLLLHFVGSHARLHFRPGQRFRLDLFVPGASSPVRAVVRPVRPVGKLEAFELVEISEADRLTLAEYLDRLMTSSDTLRAAVRFPRWRAS